MTSKRAPVTLLTAINNPIPAGPSVMQDGGPIPVSLITGHSQSERASARKQDYRMKGGKRML